MVDVFSAASRSDLFLQSDIVAKKSLEYPSAYGFVLSGDMKNAAPEFRRYLSSQADKILNFMKEKSAGLEVIHNSLNQGSGAFSSQRAILPSYCKMNVHGSHEILFKQ